MAEYVQVGAVKTWYDEQGSGDPLVLMQCGLVDARFFEPNLGALAERFHVYTPERRGHGHTPDVPGPITYQLIADVEMYEALPNAELAVLPGTSHFLTLEKPHVVNQLGPRFPDHGPGADGGTDQARPAAELKRRRAIAAVVWHVTKSRDGFIAGPDDSMDWVSDYFSEASNETAGEVVETTGAIIMGRGHLRRRGLVPARHRRRRLDRAVFRPQARAGEGCPRLDGWHVHQRGHRGCGRTRDAGVGGKNVGILGANLAQQCLDHGLFDEIIIHLAPGSARRRPAPVRSSRQSARPARADPGEAHRTTNRCPLPRQQRRERRPAGSKVRHDLAGTRRRNIALRRLG
jgi:hypothetical protein